MDIQKLIQNYQNYFWSEKEGVFICGGHNHGRFFGEIRIKVEDEEVKIETEISNGVTDARGGPKCQYHKGDSYYQIIIEFIKKLKEYLLKPETIVYHDLHREKLMENVFSFLPKY